jgi:hypothetical protein
MKFTIQGKTIDVDETKEYFDYFTQGLVKTDFIGLLKDIEDGKITIEGLDKFLYLRTRWVKEAPRRRFYRDMARAGAMMMSSDNFFTEDGGDKIIDSLELTGKLAVYLRKELFGLDDVIKVEEYAVDP